MIPANRIAISATPGRLQYSSSLKGDPGATGCTPLWKELEPGSIAWCWLRCKARRCVGPTQGRRCLIPIASAVRIWALDGKDVRTTMIYTHVLNRGG